MKWRREKSHFDVELANLPGVRQLREVVADARRQMPSQTTLRHDGVAGLTVAIANVPEGMAGGLLAGVNPIYGLYASMVGPIVGGLLSSTRLMVITNTSAAALVAGQALTGMPSDQHDSRLFLMIILAGLFAIIFGLLGFGRMTRFVSYSVMTGFLAGIAVVLILSQLPTIVGYPGQGANRVTQTLDLLRRLDDLSLVSLGLTALTVALMLVLQHTRADKFASLVAIIVPTAVVALFGLTEVRTVREVGTMPEGIPLPIWPNFADSLEVLTGALSVAVIVLVQGSGVSQSVPNPDGSRSRASRDFVAQGAANIASGFFRGLPVGGSLAATALNVVAGASRRWASVFAGLWMAVIVIALPDLVALVAMPALAGLLVVVGVSSIKAEDVTSVWRAGWRSRLACVATFVATLVLPIQIAVAIGVAISTLLYVSRSSTDITVVELIERPDGRFEERKPPERLPGEQVTVLDIYGHIFYAGARTLERLLPQPAPGAEHPVVVLRLRGRTKLGATLEEVLSHYAGKLAETHGRLYLAGLSEEAHRVVAAMAKLQVSGPVRAYEVTPILGESMGQARADAEAWLIGLKDKA